MDNLTKGALGATAVLALGAVGFGFAKMTKDSNDRAERAEEANAALMQQITDDRKQREDDKAAEMQRQMAAQKEATEAQLAALRAEMAANAKTVAEERRIMEAERAQLTETIADTVGKGGAISEADAEMNAMQKKILEAAAIGKVVQVNEEFGFVVVGAGSANGMQPEQKYNVRRDMFIVGEIQIASVEDEKHSVGNIVPGSTQPGLSLRAGDELISHPIY